MYSKKRKKVKNLNSNDRYDLTKIYSKTKGVECFTHSASQEIFPPFGHIQFHDYTDNMPMITTQGLLISPHFYSLLT